MTGLFPPTLLVRLEAHAAVKGMGEFVGGFLHPLLTPPHLLVILGTGLLIGRSSPQFFRSSTLVFVGSAALGLMAAGLGGVAATAWPVVLIVTGLIAGAGVALAAPLPTWARLAVCVVAGVSLGLDSGVDPGTSGAAVAKTLFGTWLGLGVCVVNVAFYSARLPASKWVQTGVRIVGSWIAAIAMLMLAFLVKR